MSTLQALEKETALSVTEENLKKKIQGIGLESVGDGEVGEDQANEISQSF